LQIDVKFRTDSCLLLRSSTALTSCLSLRWGVGASPRRRRRRPMGTGAPGRGAGPGSRPKCTGTGPKVPWHPQSEAVALGQRKRPENRRAANSALGAHCCALCALISGNVVLRAFFGRLAAWRPSGAPTPPPLSPGRRRRLTGGEGVAFPPSGDPGGGLTSSLSVSQADHGQAQPPLHRGCKHSPRFSPAAHSSLMVCAPPPHLSLSAPGSPISNFFPPRGARLSHTSSALPTRNADCVALPQC